MRPARVVVWALSLAVVASVGLLATRAPAGDGPPTPSGPTLDDLAKGDAVLVFSGDEKGILKPCGCSFPMMGGLERRAALIERLRARSKAVAALSVGETLGEVFDSAQAGLKADLFRAGLSAMGYAGTLLSAADLSPFVPGLSQPYGGGEADVPRPPLNVKLKEKGSGGVLARVDPVLRFRVGELSVRAVSVVDPTLRESLAGLGIADAVLAPEDALRALPKEAGLLVVVSHAWREELVGIARGATDRADGVVIVDVARQVADGRPVRGRVLDKPLFVDFDEYGKQVGVLRVVAREGRLVVDYDRVALDPSLEEGDSALRSDVEVLFAAYRRRVKEDGILEAYPRHSDGPTWVGSKACRECHPAIYDSWEKTPHARAMDTLTGLGVEDDPECVRCHTVGWERGTRGDWMRSESAFFTLAKTPGLVGVGCESCHGPGAAHVKEPKRRDLFGGWRESGKQMWRAPGRRGCQECHDVENSHGFHARPDAYSKDYLPVVDHRDVPEAERKDARPAMDR